MKSKNYISNLVVHIILIFIILYMVTPIFWMGLTSLKTEKEIYQTPLTIFPHELTFENYVSIFRDTPDFKRYLANSIIVTVISSVIALMLGALGGYSLGRFEFKLKSCLWVLLIILIALPYGVYLIPIYLAELKVNLINTYTGLILPYAVLNLPWVIFVMTASFRAIPKEIEESAIIDGANYFQSFLKIMMPIARQGLIAAFIFIFINIWSDLLFVMALTSTNNMRTLSYGILLLRDESQSFAYTTLAPGILLSIVPTLFMFIFLQNYFIKGATEGSIK